MGDICCKKRVKKKEKEESIVPGLYNFEGNCYLNSILQCFYYCNDLTKYFIDNENEIIKNNGQLSIAYLNLILRLNKKEKYNDAKNFLDALQEVSVNFFNKGGNDPKAVLLYFLHNLHNELKEQDKYYIEEDSCCEDIDQESVFLKCKNNAKYNKSIISELFNWCLLTSNDCIKCGNTHYNCEYRNHILIELKSYKTIEGYVSLNELIQFYFQDSIKNFICTFNEDNNNEVFKVKYTKKIISLPQYLIIILNRDIIQYNVIYDDIIDLSEYCVNKNKAKYKFISVTLTNDFGYKKGTHAIARCITQNGSFIFNDLNTLEIEKDLEGYNPYILFYKKSK
jgi:ubiquitin C-terminal hydrolase